MSIKYAGGYDIAKRDTTFRRRASAIGLDKALKYFGKKTSAIARPESSPYQYLGDSEVASRLSEKINLLQACEKVVRMYQQDLNLSDTGVNRARKLQASLERARVLLQSPDISDNRKLFFAEKYITRPVKKIVSGKAYNIGHVSREGGLDTLLRAAMRDCKAYRGIKAYAQRRQATRVPSVDQLAGRKQASARKPSVGAKIWQFFSSLFRHKPSTAKIDVMHPVSVDQARVSAPFSNAAKGA